MMSSFLWMPDQVWHDRGGRQETTGMPKKSDEEGRVIPVYNLCRGAVATLS